MINYDSKLVMLVGNIGSGKTTVSTKFVNKGYVCISRDALRHMLGNGKYVFTPETESLIALGNLLLIEEFMRIGINIVLDEVNVSPRIRMRILALAKRYNYHVTAYVLPKYAKYTCVNRRMKNPHGRTDKQKWTEVWEKFNRIYVTPTTKEGFDRIIHHK